jgi:hypothetical protein
VVDDPAPKHNKRRDCLCGIFGDEGGSGLGGLSIAYDAIIKGRAMALAMIAKWLLTTDDTSLMGRAITLRDVEVGETRTNDATFMTISIAFRSGGLGVNVRLGVRSIIMGSHSDWIICKGLGKTLDISSGRGGSLGCGCCCSARCC